jgi:hypothetical protein
LIFFIQSDWIYLVPGATKKNGKLGETMFYSTDHVEAHIASNPHLLPKGVKAPTCTNSAAWRTGALKSSAAKAKSIGAKKKKATVTTPKPATKAASKAKTAAKAAKATKAAAAASAAAAAAASADDSNSDQSIAANDMEDANDDDDDDTIDTAEEIAAEEEEGDDSNNDDDGDDDDTEASEVAAASSASQEEVLVFSPVAMGNSVLSMSARTNCSQRGPRRSRRAFDAAGSGAANKGRCLAFCMVRTLCCTHTIACSAYSQ